MINYSFDAIKYMCDPEHGPTGMFPSSVGNTSTNATATILLQQSHQAHQIEQPSQQIEQSHDQDIIKEQSNGKRKHCVWDYYELINGKASCRTCGRTISATTTLAKGHLKAFHTDLFIAVEQKEEQRKELNPTSALPKRRKTPQLHHIVGEAPGSGLYDKSYSRLEIAGVDYNVRKMTPTVRMSRTECFSAAHRLHNPELSEAQNVEMYGKCNNLHGHGHNYEWKVVLEGRINMHTGMVYDLADLKRAMNEVLLKVDHKNLDVDNDYFRNNHLVSTTENLAVYLYHQIKVKLKPPEILKKVVIYETNKNRFSYSGG